MSRLIRSAGLPQLDTSAQSRQREATSIVFLGIAGAVGRRACLAPRQHIHERGFASAGDAHEASQAPGAEGAADVIQQRQLRL